MSSLQDSLSRSLNHEAHQHSPRHHQQQPRNDSNLQLTRPNDHRPATRRSVSALRSYFNQCLQSLQFSDLGDEDSSSSSLDGVEDDHHIQQLIANHRSRLAHRSTGNSDSAIVSASPPTATSAERIVSPALRRFDTSLNPPLYFPALPPMPPRSSPSQGMRTPHTHSPTLLSLSDPDHSNSSTHIAADNIPSLWDASWVPPSATSPDHQPQLNAFGSPTLPFFSLTPSQSTPISSPSHDRTSHYDEYFEANDSFIDRNSEVYSRDTQPPNRRGPNARLWRTGNINTDSVFANPTPLSNEPTAAMEDLLKCFICLDNLVEAVMCPHCSKMGCKLCFERWLVNERSQCPHCRHQLYADKLVQCRFVADLQNQVKRLASSRTPAVSLLHEWDQENEICTVHNAQLYYYCLTCHQPMCSDCALFDSLHCGHEFVHFQKVYEDHMLMVSGAINGFEECVDQHANALAHVTDRIARLQRSGASVQQEMRDILNESILSTHLQLADRFSMLDYERSRFERNKKKLTELSERIKATAKGMSHQRLVRESRSLIVEIQRAKDEIPEPDFETLLLTEISNPLMPKFVSQTVILPGLISATRNQTYFTSPFVAGGITWQIYVRLEDMVVGGEQYLGIGIAVDLVDGLVINQSAEYQWRTKIQSVPCDHVATPGCIHLNRCQGQDPFASDIRSNSPMTFPRASNRSTATPSPSYSPQEVSRAPDTPGQSPAMSLNSEQASGVWGFEPDFTHMHSRLFRLGDRVKDRHVYPVDRAPRTGDVGIVFSVRPTSYQQRVSDLERWAAKLLRENQVLRVSCSYSPSDDCGPTLPNRSCSVRIDSFTGAVKKFDIGTETRGFGGAYSSETELGFGSIPSDGAMALLSPVIRSASASESDGEIQFGV